MASQSSSNSSKKPVRRRCHARKISQGSVINMAEARRKIAHALLLHRSSSSSSSTSSSTSTANTPICNVSQPWMFGNSYSYTRTKRPNNVASSSYCCYSLVEPMPLPVPEPVWSTTAPSVVPVAPPGFEAMEFFEWAGHQASVASSAYTCWFAFLRALDGDNIH